MKIVYMGTPDFAVPALKALAAAGETPVLAVTKPDRPKDRGKKMQSCPVKLAAQLLGIPVETPEKLKNNREFEEMLRALAPDLMVVAAYGKILPKAVLDIPRLGCINIHASLLPEYRGAAPIHRAVIDGKEETGVSLMYMAEALDAGDVIAQAKTPVAEKTTEMLFDELAQLGAKLLIETLPALAAGTVTRTPQNESLVTYAPMVFKEDGIIDFSMPARKICCIIRGFNSWPTASTVYCGQVMKVHMAKEAGKAADLGLPAAAPGTVLKADKTGIYVACGNAEVVALTNIQLPGKKAMEVSAWLLGNKIEIGTVLG
ncbi:MAG: methionyl-tRNA formyltransferase [Firmicutes bacterium]|nr:methionyl-tRNA formyltransferase [Bacillota bacterium]